MIQDLVCEGEKEVCDGGGALYFCNFKYLVLLDLKKPENNIHEYALFKHVQPHSWRKRDSQNETMANIDILSQLQVVRSVILM